MRCLLVAINSKYIHSNPAVYLLRECALRDLSKSRFWGRGGTGWVHNKPSRIRDFWWYLSSSCRSCLLFLLYMEYRVCKTASAKLKKSLSKCQNLVGGPEVSYDCESFLRSLLQVDGVLYGEGEKSFPALIEYYAAREKMQIHYPKHFQMGRHGWMKTESSTRQVRSRSHR